MKKLTFWPKRLKLSKIFNLKSIVTVVVAILFLALTFLPISAPKPAFAYPGTVIDSFTNEAKVASKSNITVDTGNGQVKLDLDTVEFDYMEYSTDDLAQAAYVSSDTAYTDDLTSGQTITASSMVNHSNRPSLAFDDNLGSSWASASDADEWISCQFSSSKVIKRITIRQHYHTAFIKHCKLEGSNNGSDWTKISASGWSGQASQYNTDEILMSAVVSGVGTIDFDNSTEYTYYRIYGSDSYGLYVATTEIEMMEISLQSYSEDTIKQQGTYSLKAVARATDSLDDTLTRTVSPTIDLSDKNEIKFDVRASRTGTNLQAQIHDSGGTTTSYDIAISTANAWETKTWDISGVDNTDKDAIDQIIFKVTNADADNTFYVDNIYLSGQYYSSGTLTSTNLLLGLLGSLDYMEYSTDALAQTAYVSSDEYSDDLCSGGTATADSQYSVSYIPAYAFDDNAATYWASTNTAMPHWIKYAFASSIVAEKLTLQARAFPSSNACVKDFKLEGSNNDSDWTELLSDTNPDDENVHTYTFSNSTSYIYYRIRVLNNYLVGTPNYAEIREIEVMETHLQSYSESTIKQQGTYSLKAVARATDSLDDTLTRTVSPTIDLSDKNEIKFDIRASRTGTNLQAQIHDSGGTTTIYNISISTANTWETKTWDISGVDNTDKDAIDKIIFKVTNADADNTFYIDNMYPSGLTIGSIDSFGYIASVPDGTSLKVQFSQDGSTWCDASGDPGTCDGNHWEFLLTTGTEIIIQLPADWTGPHFYYKAQFTSGSTPVLDEISVSYSEAGGEGGEAVPEFTTLTFIIAAVAGFGIYFLIRKAKSKNPNNK